MRTTVAIDDHLLERAKERAQRQGVTLGELLEQSLRTLLARSPETTYGPPLPVFHGESGFAPGIDPTSNASLYEATGEDMKYAKHFRR